MSFDTQELPLELAALIPGQIRISWSIAGVSGHGHWFHHNDRALLQGWCDELNERYGAGTHWIEVCGGGEK